MAWGVSVWPRRGEVMALWQTEAAGQRCGTVLAVNLVLFCLLVVAAVLFSVAAAPLKAMPWGWFALFCVPLFATGVSLVLLAAPARFWARLAVQQ